MLVLHVSNIAPRVRQLSSWGASCIGEGDCKEQFNRIKLATTIQELREALQYLYHKKQWSALILYGACTATAKPWQ